jgi:hypothetical protein
VRGVKLGQPVAGLAGETALLGHERAVSHQGPVEGDGIVTVDWLRVLVS